MLRAFLIVLLLLPTLGWSFTLTQGEVLSYGVYWGPFKLGKGSIVYNPAPNKGYSLIAQVKDASMFIDLDDIWTTIGTHAKKPFTPITHASLQHENDYRANKLTTFNAKTRKITYTNHIDASDIFAPIPYTNQRDPLSALYAWRINGLDEVQRGGSVNVIGVKRPFTLVKTPGVKKTMTIRGKEVDVWEVLLTKVEDGKAPKESWAIRLTDDANLTPVQIIANTKFGSFRATLEQ